MPTDPLRFPYRSELLLPVIGLESEFKVFIDDSEVVPEDVWRTPSGFIERPLLQRSSKSSQLPTGGAVYFDGGVLEVVTPVIEIAPQCTARVVRSLWEQIGFIRDELDGLSRRLSRPRPRRGAFHTRAGTAGHDAGKAFPAAPAGAVPVRRAFRL